MTKNLYILGGILGVIALVGFIGFLRFGESNEPIIGVDNGILPEEENIVEIDGGGIETDWDTSSDVSTIKKPDLTKKPEFSTTLSDFAKGKILQDVTNLQAALVKDSENVDAWLNLGIQFKVAGDYKSTEEIWRYVSLLKPKQSIAFSNLGLLYGYYLGDAVRAETNFLRAIENDQKIGYYYLNLADFYLDALKNKQKAINILEKGILALPGDVSLKKTLESLR